MTVKVLTHEQDFGNFILFKKSPNLSFDKLVDFIYKVRFCNP